LKEPGYFKITRTATYSFLVAVPLLAAYEILILLVNDGTDTSVRVGADVWIKQIISLVGDPGMFAIGLVVLAVGIWVVRRDRKKGLPIRPKYFGWMLAESLAYAVVVAFVVSRLVGALYYNAALGDAGMAPQELGLPKMLALSLGAGLYEELVFRVFLVGGLFWGLSKWRGRSKPKLAEGETPRPDVFAYVLSAIIGALLFSAVHYIGAYGDPFQLPSFTFRFLFGLALNALFLLRGFGIAAWTHALYDILVVTNTL
jgi:membrane protease YdiL (CAAX protease family)